MHFEHNFFTHRPKITLDKLKFLYNQSINHILFVEL